MITRDLMAESQIFWPIAHLDYRLMANLAEAAYAYGCFENMGVPFCMTVEAEAMGATVDMGNDLHEPHVIKYVYDRIPDLDSLSMSDYESGRGKVTIDAIKELKGRNLDAPIIGNITGPVSTASSVVDPMGFYKDLRKNPERASAYMDFVTDNLIDFAGRMIDAGADLIAVSDPSGTGEILGPKNFALYTVPYLNKIVDYVHGRGKKCIVHICGNMTNVYEEINKVRADALSFDSIVPMSQAKEALKGRVLMGNVSTYTLEFGDREQIEKMTEACVRNGSSIVSPACGLGTKSSIENIKTMLETVKKNV